MIISLDKLNTEKVQTVIDAVYEEFSAMPIYIDALESLHKSITSGSKTSKRIRLNEVFQKLPGDKIYSLMGGTSANEYKAAIKLYLQEFGEDVFFNSFKQRTLVKKKLQSGASSVIIVDNLEYINDVLDEIENEEHLVNDEQRTSRLSVDLIITERDLKKGTPTVIKLDQTTSSKEDLATVLRMSFKTTDIDIKNIDSILEEEEKEMKEVENTEETSPQGIESEPTGHSALAIDGTAYSNLSMNGIEDELRAMVNRRAEEIRDRMHSNIGLEPRSQERTRRAGLYEQIHNAA